MSQKFEPYAFYCNKRIWIDQKLWINQDVIDGPPCMLIYQESFFLVYLPFGAEVVIYFNPSKPTLNLV